MTRRNLTRVGLLFVPERVNDRLRFGEPIAKRTLSPRCAVIFFKPGALFGYVLWRANAFGTTLWRVLVLRAVGAGERAATLPGVSPGADILLDASGEARARRVLAVVDAIEARGLAPATLPESYWRTVHNRLAAGLEPRVYGAAERATSTARHGEAPR